MQKIFIVEDDLTIVKSLKTALSSDFRVSAVMNFRAVAQEIREAEPDLILMDIGLPYFNGFYWTKKLRQSAQTPLIFISSASDELNQLTALASGADDFVVKPFSLEVLKAKCHALLRRTHLSRLEFAGFVLEENLLKSATAAEVELTASESKLLTPLFRAQGKVVKKEALLEALWQTSEFIDANSLAVKMTRLRRKLAEIGFDGHIETVRGVGYALR